MFRWLYVVGLTASILESKSVPIWLLNWDVLLREL